MSFKNDAIMLDIVSDGIMVGLGNEPLPRDIFPLCYGQPKVSSTGQPEYLFGIDAVDHGEALNLVYPVQNGLVEDWRGLERVLEYTFDEVVGVPADRAPVLIMVHPLMPGRQRAKLAQLLFEKFHVPALQMQTPAIAIHAGHCATGVVVHCSNDRTLVIPCLDGQPIPHAIRECRISGSCLSTNLLHMLREQGLPLNAPGDLDIAADIKFWLGYVAEDFNAEQEKEAAGEYETCSYEMPDGQMIEICGGLHRSIEPLFQPASIGIPAEGLQQTIANAISAVEPWLRKRLYRNIVVCGSETHYPGFCRRLSMELKQMAPAGMDVCIVAPVERRSLTWRCCACLSGQPQHWIGRETFARQGGAGISPNTRRNWREVGKIAMRSRSRVKMMLYRNG